MIEIGLQGTQECLRELLPLVREGVGLDLELGGSLDDLLIRQLGMTPEYVAERVMTIFLDGAAVDDTASATIRSGSAVALAAAMPGLAGAALRKGSPISGFRGPQCAGEGGGTAGCGRIVCKLFGHVAQECGPDLLARGCVVPAARLARRVRSLLKEGAADETADWNGESVPVRELPERLDGLAASGTEVLLRLST